METGDSYAAAQNIDRRVFPVCAGTLLAYSQGGPISWQLAFLAWLVAFFVQTGSHLVNDALDLKKGADTEKRTGPMRATQKGLISITQAFWGGIGSLGLALLLEFP